jgi:hypothetical protein
MDYTKLFEIKDINFDENEGMVCIEADNKKFYFKSEEELDIDTLSKHGNVYVSTEPEYSDFYEGSYYTATVFIKTPTDKKPKLPVHARPDQYGMFERVDNCLFELWWD